MAPVPSICRKGGRVGLNMNLLLRHSGLGQSRQQPAGRAQAATAQVNTTSFTPFILQIASREAVSGVGGGGQLLSHARTLPPRRDDRLFATLRVYFYVAWSTVRHYSPPQGWTKC